MPSLLQPFIGHAADRISLRYFIILAPATTATLCGLLGLANSYTLLAMLLFVIGVSMAIFHAPAPAMVGRISGDRLGTGMSIFMAAGELGRTVGPAVVIAAVTWFGLEGIWRVSAFGWLASVFLYWRLRGISARPAQGKRAFTATDVAGRAAGVSSSALDHGVAGVYFDLDDDLVANFHAGCEGI